MRVGYGVTLLSGCLRSGEVDGIGSYTRELLNALSSRKDLDLTLVSFGVPVPDKIKTSLSKKVLPAYPLSAVTSAVTGLPFAGTSRLVGKLDLMHATDHLVPNLGKVPIVATLMDTIPLSHPEWVSSRFRGLKNCLWKRASRWADQVITISEYSKGQIEEHFGLPSERISVIPLGVDERWFDSLTQEQMAKAATRLSLPDKYFLFVGTLQPRKNLGRVIDAYRALPKGLSDEVSLLIVGRAGWQCDDVVTALESRAFGPSVRWLKHLSNDDLLVVLKSSTALVFPSLCEGFGLPVLEAFAAGIPVITSNIAAMPEVAGDAAFLVNPFDESAIADAMERLLENEVLAQSLRHKGVLRAREYTWDRTASMTVDVYRRVS